MRRSGGPKLYHIIAAMSCQDVAALPQCERRARRLGALPRFRAAAIRRCDNISSRSTLRRKLPPPRGYVAIFPHPSTAIYTVGCNVIGHYPQPPVYPLLSTLGSSAAMQLHKSRPRRRVVPPSLSHNAALKRRRAASRSPDRSGQRGPAVGRQRGGARGPYAPTLRGGAPYACNAALRTATVHTYGRAALARGDGGAPPRG